MGTSLVSSMGSTCLYDIGDILQTTNSKNPSERWNGTEWTQIKGRFLLGADDSHAIGSTGGEFNHTLTVDEIPSHNHVGIDVDNMYYLGWENGNLEGINYLNQYQNFTSDVQNKLKTGYTGGNSPHNITPLPCGLYLAKNSVKTVLCKVVKL